MAGHVTQNKLLDPSGPVSPSSEDGDDKRPSHWNVTGLNERRVESARHMMARRFTLSVLVSSGHRTNLGT